MIGDPHPPLSALPVAFVLLLVVVEGYHAWRQDTRGHYVAWVVWVALLFGAVAAFFSGYFAAGMATVQPTDIQDAIAEHHRMGRTMLFVLLPTFGLRLLWWHTRHRTVRVVYVVGLLASLTMVGATAWRGGELVFQRGVGVVADPGTHKYSP